MHANLCLIEYLDELPGPHLGAGYVIFCEETCSPFQDKINFFSGLGDTFILFILMVLLLLQPDVLLFYLPRENRVSLMAGTHFYPSCIALKDTDDKNKWLGKVIL